MPKLNAMGFDVDIADKLHAEKARDVLYAHGRISYDPGAGLDLDVLTADRLHTQLRRELVEAREAERKRKAEEDDRREQTQEGRLRQLAKRFKAKWDSGDESASQSSEDESNDE